MRKYLGIIISLLCHIFSTVLRQPNTVSVSDGVKRNTVLAGCDGEIRGLQAEQRPHCGSLDGHAAELHGFHTASRRAHRGRKPAVGRTAHIRFWQSLRDLFAERIRR